MGPLRNPHKLFDKWSTMSLRFQAPVTTVSLEILLASQAWYILECHEPEFCCGACSEQWSRHCKKHHFYIFALVQCAEFFFQYNDLMTSFPSGGCCLGVDCHAPKHQLRKHCPGCDGLIHMLCGQCLVEDEGDFKEDSVVCPRCNLKQQQSHPSVGHKSPRRALQPQSLNAFASNHPFFTLASEVIALMSPHEEALQRQAANVQYRVDR